MGVPKIAIDYGTPKLKGISREEWEARVQLAACYRVFAHLGWTEMIYNHITLRVPGPEKHLLINPFGLHYTEITASNLVKIDLDGNILSDSRWPINPAGLGAARHRAPPHRQRPLRDAHAHHGRAGRGLHQGRAVDDEFLFRAALRQGRLPRLRGHHGQPRRRPAHAEASMGGKPILILRNHGLLAWGETLPQAFAHLWTMQRACEIQVAAKGMGDELIEIPKPVLEQATREVAAVRSQVRRRRRRVQRAGAPDRPQGSVLQELRLQPACVSSSSAPARSAAGSPAHAGARRRRGVPCWRAAPRWRRCARDGLTLLEGERRETFRLPASDRARRTCRSPMPWSWPSRPTRFADAVAAAAPALAHGPLLVTAMNGLPWWFLDGLGRAARRTSVSKASIPAARRRPCSATCVPSAPWCMPRPAPRHPP